MIDKKVLLIANLFPPPSYHIKFYEIFKRYPADKLIIIAPKNSGFEQFDRSLQCPVYRVKLFPDMNLLDKILRRFSEFLFPNAGDLFVYFKQLFWITIKLLFTYRFSHIYCSYAKCALLPFLLKKVMRIPYFLFIQGLEASIVKKSQPHKASFRMKIFQNVEILIANSNFTKRELLKWGLPENKIRVLPLGVAHEIFTPQGPNMKHNNRNKIIITVCKVLLSKKGIDSVIKSIPKIIERFPNFEYWIIGEDANKLQNYKGSCEINYKQRLEALAKELGILKHIRFLGTIAYNDLPLYYRSADVYIMLSKEDKQKGEFEGFGKAFIEANACGIPTVGSNVGGIPDAIHHGVSGFLVKHKNENEVAEAVVRLLEDKKLAKKIGEAGRKIVEEVYNWENTILVLKRIEREALILNS